MRYRSQYFFRYIRAVGRSTAAFVAICAVAAAFAVSVNINAQPLPDSSQTLSIGGYVGGNLNLHGANFESLPGVPTGRAGDNVRFGNALGFGFAAGVSAEFAWTDMLSLALRLSVGTHGGSLRAIEPQRIGTLNTAGTSVTFYDGQFGRTLDAALTMLSASPLFGIRPFAGQPGLDALKFYVGAKIGTWLNPTFSQQESILEPDDPQAVFNNLQKSRNPQAGSIPQMSPVFAGASVGLAYDVPLDGSASERPSLFLSPEIFYTLGLTPLVSGIQWNLSTASLHLTFRYALPPPPPVPPAPPPPPPPAPQMMIATVGAFSVDTSGAEVPLVQIKVEEFVSRQMYPVLPFVFFDQNSAVLPARYHRLSSEEVATFNENNFYNTDALKVYYDVLNVIGKRLRTRSKSKITLIGCNDNTGVEANNQDLSRRRAENIRQYLRDTWGIEPTRVDIQVRNLPEKPTVSRDGSAEDEEKRREENRRVEITSDDWEIIRPSLVYDTLLVPSAPVIKFRMNVRNAEGGVAKSTLRAYQGKRTLKQYSTLGSYDPEFSWNTAREQTTVPRTEEMMKFSFEAVDNDGNSAMPIDSVPVEQVTIRKKRSLRIKDKEIDTYRLILFDFDSPAVLKDNQKIIQEIVLPNVKPTSTAQITGYTDKLGSAEVNQRLSEGRAKSVADILRATTQQTNAKGMGAKQIIYPNDIPEGRFLSRTVEVRIETPIENE
jgi:outer membrane protein OmpA-like peptidoglycan-associated protein